MKTVYLIYEGSGSWEDYREHIVDSKLTLKDAESKVLELKNIVELKEKKLEKLLLHYDSCNNIDCSICDEFYELGNELEKGYSYWIIKVNTPEVEGEEFSLRRDL